MAELFTFKDYYEFIDFNVKKEIRREIKFTEGDTYSRGFYVTLWQRNKKITPTTQTMDFLAVKPDGTRVIAHGAIDGEYFRIDLPNQALAVPGYLLCALMLKGPEGQSLEDVKFLAYVHESQADGAIISQDERGILDRAFELATDVVPVLENLEADLTQNEIDRQIAETGRVDAENTRAGFYNGFNTELGKKVDKVDGKQLSDQNFTAQEKTKLSKVPDDTNTSLSALTTDVNAQLAEIVQREKEIISGKLFNKNTATLGQTLKVSGGIDGSIIPDINRFTSEYIKIKPNMQYYTSLSIPCLYDSNLNYIGNFNGQNVFTTPPNAAYFRGCGSISVIDNFTLNEGVTQINDTYKFKLKGLTVDGLDQVILDAKNSVTFNSEALQSTIGNVTISGRTVTINAINKGGYNTIRFWYYKSDSGLYSDLNLNIATQSYTLNPWQNLVLDLQTNTIKQLNAGATLPKYFIPLAVAGFDTINSGYFFELYLLGKSNTPLPANNDLYSYLIPNISQQVQKIIDIGKANLDICNLAWMTDSHINGVTADNYKVINEITNSLGIDTVISGGDNILYNQNKKLAVMEHIKFVRRLKGKLLYAIGNHDSNAWEQSGHNQPISEVITNSELYNVYGKKYANDFAWGSKTDMYYYYDVPNTNIRIVVLNSNDTPIIDNGDGTTKYNPGKVYGVRQTQVEWLANVALNTNKHILISIHISPVKSSEGIYYNSVIYNYEKIRAILEAFKNGTSFNVASSNDKPEFDINVSGSFSGAGNIIAVMSGHIHLDNNVVINGINYITRNSDYAQSWTATVPDKDGNIPIIPPRVIGTDSELCVDVLSIDTTTKKMYITRFGNIGMDLMLPY